MEPEDIDETRRKYRERWEQYGYDPRTLYWDKGRQQVRFTAALEVLRPNEYGSVIDIGCGFGDFFAHLKALGWCGQYTGVDIVPELLAEARRRHCEPNASFHCADIQEQPLDVRAAMGVALGIFNHRLKQDNMLFISSMLEAMWNHTTDVVVLDFLSTSADIRRDELFYADPRAIYDLARRFSRRVMIHHAYIPFEFQVKVWHDDSFEVRAPVFPPYSALL